MIGHKAAGTKQPHLRSCEGTDTGGFLSESFWAAWCEIFFFFFHSQGQTLSPCFRLHAETQRTDLHSHIFCLSEVSFMISSPLLIGGLFIFFRLSINMKICPLVSQGSTLQKRNCPSPPGRKLCSAGNFPSSSSSSLPRRLTQRPEVGGHTEKRESCGGVDYEGVCLASASEDYDSTSPHTSVTK